MAVINKIFNAALVGVVVGAFLWGFNSSQTYLYFQRFSHDPSGLKIFVAGLWVLEGFQIISTARMIYYYLITNFDNPVALATSTWEWDLYLGLSTLTAFFVQAFFARRVYMISRSFIVHWLASTIIGLLALLQLGFGLAVMADGFRVRQFQRFTEFTWGVTVWLASSAACDILIAASLCYFLHQRRTGFKSTDKIINKLMAYSIETGLLTSIAAILSVSTFTTLGFNFVHVFMTFPLGGLYVASLLATLHARSNIRGTNNHAGSSDGRGVGGVHTGTTFNFKSMPSGYSGTGKIPNALVLEETVSTGLGTSNHASSYTENTAV